MTAAPGPRQPDEESWDVAAVFADWDERDRRQQEEDAAPSAQPDEVDSWSCPNPNCPRVYEREPGIDDRQWELKRDLVAENHLWHCLYATPAQPVRDAEEGRR